MAESLSFGAKRFREFAIDGDDNHIVRIDTTDTGILARWSKAESAIEAVLADLDTLKRDGEDRETALELSQKFDDINKRSCEQVDYLFNCDLSTHVCAKYGSLLRTVDGEPLMMVLFETLIAMYNDDIKADLERSKKRIEKHTKKYIK